MSKFKKICPHSDCGKAFYVPIFKQNILFCPQCEKSLLNPDNSHISRTLLYVQKNPNSHFMMFLAKEIVSHIFLYSMIIGIIFLISYGIVYIKFSPSWITDIAKILACSVLLLMLILFVFSMYCDGKGKNSDKGSQNPLRIFSMRKFIAGVDKLAEVTSGIGIDLTLSHLKTGATTANISCQNCQSQRLIKYIFLGQLQKNYQINPIFGTVFQHIDLDKFEYKSQVLCLKCETLFEENKKSSKESGWEILFNCLFLPIILVFGDSFYDRNNFWQMTGFLFVISVFGWMMAKFFTFQEYKSRYQHLTT